MPFHCQVRPGTAFSVSCKSAYRLCLNPLPSFPRADSMKAPDFAIHSQARHAVGPNRIRHPTDWRFVSHCFPRHLTMTQLCSTTGYTGSPDRDFHPAVYVRCWAHERGRLARSYTSKRSRIISRLFLESLGPFLSTEKASQVFEPSFRIGWKNDTPILATSGRSSPCRGEAELYFQIPSPKSQVPSSL